MSDTVSIKKLEEEYNDNLRLLDEAAQVIKEANNNYNDLQIRLSKRNTEIFLTHILPILKNKNQ